MPSGNAKISTVRQLATRLRNAASSEAYGPETTRFVFGFTM